MRNAIFRGILAGFVGALTTLTCLAYPMQGVGVTSCAEFARLYQGSPEYTELMFFSWGQGYMSGLNISAMGQGFLARDLAGDLAQQIFGVIAQTILSKITWTQFSTSTPSGLPISTTRPSRTARDEI
jgi:hypothetical protein